MVPINGSYTSSYWSAVSISVTVFELLAVEEYCDLEIYVRGHWIWYHSIDRIRVFIGVYWHHAPPFRMMNFQGLRVV